MLRLSQRTTKSASISPILLEKIARILNIPTWDKLTIAQQGEILTNAKNILIILSNLNSDFSTEYSNFIRTTFAFKILCEKVENKSEQVNVFSIFCYGAILSNKKYPYVLLNSIEWLKEFHLHLYNLILRPKNIFQCIVELPMALRKEFIIELDIPSHFPQTQSIDIVVTALLCKNIYTIDHDKLDQAIREITPTYAHHTYYHDCLRGLRLMQSLLDRSLTNAEKWELLRKNTINSYVNLSGYNLNDANLNEANLAGFNLQYCTLNRANLHKANCNYTILNRANMQNANLEAANLSNALLRLAKLNKVNAKGAKFTEVDAAGAEFNHANLMLCDMTRMILSSAKLIQANLSHSTLTQSMLWMANFSGANLIRANLINAALYEAILAEADIDTATFLSEISIDTIIPMVRNVIRNIKECDRITDIIFILANSICAHAQSKMAINDGIQLLIAVQKITYHDIERGGGIDKYFFDPQLSFRSIFTDEAKKLIQEVKNELCRQSNSVAIAYHPN